jgi:hypothetical protein
VEIVGPYRLRVGFEDATEQVIDFLPVLFGEMYEPLRDLPFPSLIASIPKLAL